MDPEFEREHEELPFFRRRRTWLVLVAIALMTGVAWWLPLDGDGTAAAGLDVMEVKVGLGIFAGVAFLWLTEALPLAVTALLVPALATLWRVSDLKAALVPFADPLIFIFLGGFALAAAMSRQGIDRWIARNLVRMGKGRFLAVAVGLFGATAFLSMWISNTATTAMMLPLALGLLASAKVPNPRNAVFMLLGLAYASSIGGLGTLIGSPPNGIAAKQLGIDFTEWLRFGIPAVLVLLPAMIVVLHFLCRPDREVHLEMDGARFAMTGPRRATLGIFGATAACWVGGAWIAPALGVTGSFDSLVALVAIGVMLFFGVVRWQDIDRGTEWGVLLLFGGGLALSAVLKETGASLFLARVLGETIGAWPPLLITAGVVAFVIGLTELTSNTACAALFVPVFHALAEQLGMVPSQLVTPLALAASCAFMLPVATPPNAIVFGSGQVPQRQMIRVGLVLNVVFVVLLTLLSKALF
ncbi:SLC13 family permease [Luteolibacter marinus]|uniref:SLC13 family permease n=1 Tax=Luteolibacter marinus TaxID=2776705 RepID=UPI001867F336|nr:DASS family sodium-coupled anion symporter [Luteolibacter marinus]